MSNKPPTPPNTVEGIWDWAKSYSDLVHEQAKARAEAIRQRRIAAQNKPATKARKSASMKRYHAEKKEAERFRKDAEAQYEEEWFERGCQCNLPNARPPCSWCERVTEEEYEKWQELYG